MFEKLEKIKKHYEELSAELAKPDIILDNKRYIKIAKEHSNLEELIESYDKYKKLEADTLAAEKIYETESDAELRDMAYEEIGENREKLKELEDQLKILLLPKDENDEKNVIMEIRAGTGGEEACLFANSLMRMYRMFAETHGFSIEVMDILETELGGIKEVTLLIKGKNAFATFKYESGTHRVQRVPETEAQGRLQTSAVTVAVLPEMQEVEFEIDPKDIRIDVYRSSGAGGQKVNKTSSAIRITHFPTGIVVACQDERNQQQNKERAFIILKSRLYDYYQGQKEAEYKQTRKMQVGSGDRSERIRTYNYPQSRVTDHRINYSTYNFERFMDGELDDMIKALTIADQQAKLMAEDKK